MNLLLELRRRNVLRVCGAYLVLTWLLLQIGEVLFDFLDVPDWAGKLLIAFLAIGFVPVILFSWAYELTPEGLKKEEDVDRSESITHHTARKLDVITITLLIAAIGVVMLDRFVFEAATTPARPDAEHSAEPGPTATAEIVAAQTNTKSAPALEIDEDSIAVLPFVNMSADPDNEYFSDGLSETLLHMLAQVNGLKVAARTSSFAFKGQNKNISEIADTLKVAHVLEGSVQKAGQRVRITAQLIDASEGTHLWSDNFDRDLEDIFAIQDEIARHVIEALKVELLGDDRARIAGEQTDNVEAYEAYLRGLQLLPERTTRGLKAAMKHFESAAELDPDYAMTYARLYDATDLLAEYGTVMPREMARANAALDRALALAPDIGVVQASLGARLRDRGEFAAAEAAFKRALELAPSYATAHHYYAHMLRNDLGRYEEALEHHRIAYELDPLSPVIQANVGWSLQAAGQLEEAQNMFEAVIEDHPTYPLGPWSMGMHLWEVEGDLAAARKWLARVRELDPGAVQYALFHCYLMSDLRAEAEARACVDEIAGRAPESADVRLAQSGMDLLANDPSAAAARALALLSEAPDLPPVQTRGAAQILMLAGQDERALELHRTLMPDLFLADPDFRNNELQPAIDAGTLLLRSGAAEQGRAILELALERMEGLDRIRGWDRFGWYDIYALAALGREAQAVEAFREAVASGLRAWNSEIDLRPELDPIRDHPAFQAAMADLLADLKRQREEMDLTAAD